MKGSAMKRLLIIMLFLLLALTGCAGTEKYNPTTDFVLTTNNFCEALRWKDFFGASRYVVPAAQEEFLAQFEEDPDLFVVDSRVKKIDLEKKENGAEVVYEWNITTCRRAGFGPGPGLRSGF